MRRFVTGVFGIAVLQRAGLGIFSKQRVLQYAVKEPAVFKGSNLVRKTSKKITLVGIELNSPGVANAFKGPFIPRPAERIQPGLVLTKTTRVRGW